MPLVWVTGNSGVGKSTLCELLQARGHIAFDTDDDGYSGWVSRTSGEVIDDPPYPVPTGWLDRFGWVIQRERVAQQARTSSGDVAFLCGSAENEADVRDLFDLIVCLVIDDDTLRHRLATRTTNAFGRNPEELAAAVECNNGMRLAYESLGAVIIDARQPLEAVADLVLDAARRFAPSAS